MRKIQLGDVTITSIIERDGPWRKPQEMFPAWTDEVGFGHLKTLEPEMYDAASGKMVITYQTFVVQTPKHTMLVDTCVGEDKNLGAPFNSYPKQPWLDGFAATGLKFEDIDYVFCTHLHVDHCGWNTRLVNGRWVPTFPKAKYVFHKKEYAAWEEATRRGDHPPGEVWRMNCEPVVAAGQALLVDDDYALDDTITLTPTPGHAPCHCCINIHSRGQKAVVTGDLFHHALQVREPSWNTIFDWDAQQGIESRRSWLQGVADTSTVVLPVHFPSPVAGRISSLSRGFDYKYIRS